MRIQDVIWTKKMRAVLADKAQVIYLTGATGCSKSLVAGYKFMDWMLNAPKEQNQFYIIFTDRGTGGRNFLDDPNTVYNQFAHLRREYKANPVGGLQFEFVGLHGTKNVYILGASNKKAWSKILGSNPDGIWLEELSELDIDLIKECLGRAISRNCKLIATTNGGYPGKPFYTDYVNHAMVQFADTVPQVELDYMKQDRKYAHYYHFNLQDDAPHYTAEQMQNLLDLHKPGTFAHFSKVLGVRGYSEGVIYTKWREQEFDYLKLLSSNEYTEHFGLDFGWTNPTAFVAFLKPKDKDNKTIYVYDELYEKELTNEMLVQRLRSMGYSRKKIKADSAEPKTIDWLENNGLPNIEAVVKVTIVEGIRELQGYEIIVHIRCVHFKSEIGMYRWEKNKTTGNSKDDPVKENDHLMDAFRYGNNKEQGGLTFIDV